MLTDGYPRLDLYNAIPGDQLFREMNAYAAEFQASNAAALKYYSKRWVAKPLHHWSRRWEYLFVTEQLAASGAMAHEGELVRVLDAGSGLTFFAHWLAYKFPTLTIECCDRDPRSAASATRLGPPAQQGVTYATQDLSTLTYPYSSFSAVTCVSVLEHTDRHSDIVAEFARVLRPGGRLILTIDVSPDGRWRIPMARAQALIETLSESFSPETDYRAELDRFDPVRMLTTEHARTLDQTLLPWKWPAPRDMARNLLRPRQMFKPRFKYLTCFCMVWTRV